MHASKPRHQLLDQGLPFFGLGFTMHQVERRSKEIRLTCSPPPVPEHREEARSTS